MRTDNPDGSFNLAAWDDAGNQTERTDERGLTTQLSHDDLGRVTAEQRPDGTVVAYEYDWDGRKTKQTDPDGRSSTWTYDELGRVKTTSYPDGRSVVYAYDPAGNLVSMADSINGTTTYTYDAANQRTEMVNAVGDRTQYTYDRRGLLIREATDAKTTTYAYDARGNLSIVTSGTTVSTYTHDANGNVLVHTLPDGSTITYTYDKVDRKIGEVHSLRGETTWTWDAASRIKTETTSAGVTTYHYDSNGRVESITYPGGLVASFGYDDAGNVISMTDWVGVRTFDRDAGGRVRAFTTMQGKPGSYTYDAAGRLIAMTYQNLRNQTINRTWSYDVLGRLSAFNTGTGTITYTYFGDTEQLKYKDTPDTVREAYTYDELGRLKTQEIVGRNRLTYSYDSASRITLIERTNLATNQTIPLHRYTYTPSGQLASWWYLNDAWRTTYTYTPRGSLESMSRSLGSAPAGTNTPAVDAAIAACYQPDALINQCVNNIGTAITTLAAAVPPDRDPAGVTNTEQIQVARYMLTHPLRTRFFRHDSQDRVVEHMIWNNTAAFTNGSFRMWKYDDRGNQQPQLDTAKITYDHANRLVQYGTASNVPKLVWTHDGKLAKLDYPATSSTPDTTYDYDPEGNLLSSYWTNGSTYQVLDFAWDGEGLAAIRSYATGLLEPTRYPYFNHRGDVLTYHSRQSLSFSVSYDDRLYTPWGEVASTDWSPEFPTYGGRHGAMAIPQALGTEQDYWMGARTYNAVQGRFRQVDPLPGQDGVTDTAYSYASGDPMSRIDASGCGAVEIVLATVLVTGVIVTAAAISAAQDDGVDVPKHIDYPEERRQHVIDEHHTPSTCLDREWNNKKKWYKSYFYGNPDVTSISDYLTECQERALADAAKRTKWISKKKWRVRCKLTRVGRQHSAVGSIKDDPDYACGSGSKSGYDTKCFEGIFKKTGGNRVELQTFYPIKCRKGL